MRSLTQVVALDQEAGTCVDDRLAIDSASKSGSEFFTRQAVCEPIAQLTVVGTTAVKRGCDQVCCSGSLLLSFAKVRGRKKVRRIVLGEEFGPRSFGLISRRGGE